MIVEMVSQYQNFSSMASLFDGTLVSFSDSRIRAIKPALFANQLNLVSVNLPKCRIIGFSAFQYCYSLTSIDFPNCSYIGSSTFNWGSNLTTISFPNCSYIVSSAFCSCYNLLSVYLLGSSIPSLVSNAFWFTPVLDYTSSTGGVYGNIYAPTSLYNSYLVASNWSYYSSRIVSV